MSYPIWDLDVSLQEFKKALKHSRGRQFYLYLARVLSRVPFRDVFKKYITPQQFKKHYKKVRRLVDADLLGAGRIAFWDWVYRRL